MNSFILKVDEEEKNVAQIEIKKSYEFNPKNKKKEFIRVKKITLCDPDSLNKILTKKLLNNYNRVYNIVEAVAEDGSESDYIIALDEIQKLLEILEYKYKKFIKKEMYEKFINDLMYMRKFLEDKIISYSYAKEDNLIGKGR